MTERDQPLRAARNWFLFAVAAGIFFLGSVLGIGLNYLLVLYLTP